MTIPQEEIRKRLISISQQLVNYSISERKSADNVSALIVLIKSNREPEG